MPNLFIYFYKNSLLSSTVLFTVQASKSFWSFSRVFFLVYAQTVLFYFFFPFHPHILLHGLMS